MIIMHWVTFIRFSKHFLASVLALFTLSIRVSSKSCPLILELVIRHSNKRCAFHETVDYEHGCKTCSNKQTNKTCCGFKYLSKRFSSQKKAKSKTHLQKISFELHSVSMSVKGCSRRNARSRSTPCTRGHRPPADWRIQPYTRHTAVPQCAPCRHSFPCVGRTAVDCKDSPQ